MNTTSSWSVAAALSALGALVLAGCATAEGDIDGPATVTTSSAPPAPAPSTSSTAPPSPSATVRAAWAGGVVAIGLLALYVPAWADATSGEHVERAEVVGVETLPEGQANACTTVEVGASGQPKVERHRKYEIT